MNFVQNAESGIRQKGFDHMPINGKPRKKDFTDMREFMKAAAEWANANMGEWPWGGPKDEDDDYYFVVVAPDDAVHD